MEHASFDTAIDTADGLLCQSWDQQGWHGARANKGVTGGGTWTKLFFLLLKVYCARTIQLGDCVNWNFLPFAWVSFPVPKAITWSQTQHFGNETGPFLREQLVRMNIVLCSPQANITLRRWWRMKACVKWVGPCWRPDSIWEQTRKDLALVVQERNHSASSSIRTERYILPFECVFLRYCLFVLRDILRLKILSCSRMEFRMWLEISLIWIAWPSNGQKMVRAIRGFHAFITSETTVCWTRNSCFLLMLQAWTWVRRTQFPVTWQILASFRVFAWRYPKSLFELLCNAKPFVDPVLCSLRMDFSKFVLVSECWDEIQLRRHAVRVPAAGRIHSSLSSIERLSHELFRQWQVTLVAFCAFKVKYFDQQISTKSWQLLNLSGGGASSRKKAPNAPFAIIIEVIKLYPQDFLVKQCC